MIEWPPGEAEPTKYWMSNLAENSKLRALVALAKQRWIIERDYQVPVGSIWSNDGSLRSQKSNRGAECTAQPKN
jgi:hypothetical protein